PSAERRHVRIAYNGNRQARERVAPVNEERAIVHDRPLPLLLEIRVAPDQDDMTRQEEVRALEQGAGKCLLAPKRDLLPGRSIVNMEPFGVVASILNEHVRAPQCSVFQRVEIELAHTSARLLSVWVPPGAAGSLERIRQEIDADLRQLGSPLGIENVIGVAVQVETPFASEVGVSPLVPKHTVLLAPFSIRLVERQLFLDLGAHGPTQRLHGGQALVAAFAVQS